MSVGGNLAGNDSVHRNIKHTCGENNYTGEPLL